MQLAFYTADAFTNRPFQGAQIAVLPDACGLETWQMQRIATEFNLSETVFVFPVEGEPKTRRLRIFSPLREIDFAGHPIIAAAHILASIGNIPLEAKHTLVRFEQNTGAVDVHITEHEGAPLLVQFAVRTHPTTDRFVPPVEEIAEFLSLEISDIDTHQYHCMLSACDQPYLIVPLRSYDSVRKASFNQRAWSYSSAPSMMAREILAFSPQAADSTASFHGRLFGPEIGVKEDPPIGSSMPAFASYLCAHPQVQKGTYAFVIERGTVDQRQSLLHVEMDNKGGDELDVRMGGPAVLVSQGTILAPEA